MSPVEAFDRSAYDGLVAELGSADAAEVLCTFLADTASKLDRLLAGSLDGATTRREAHAIKSSAATFGFLELSQLAMDIEQSAMAMGPERLDAAVGELQQSFSRVRRLAEALLPVDMREMAR